MLKKLVFTLLCFWTLAASGQIRFGYLSYQKIMTMMPEYQSAIQNLNILKNKCNEEVKRSEDELERKYAEFLQGQSEFPENILQKRQNELQSLIKNGITFREETEKLLENAEKEMKSGVENKLNQAIQAVGQEYGLAFILNTDNNSCPFINKNSGWDISHSVMVKLGLIKVTPVAVPESTTTIQQENSATAGETQQNGEQHTDSIATDSMTVDSISQSLLQPIHQTDTTSHHE